LGDPLLKIPITASPTAGPSPQAATPLRRREAI